jgi:hypothetical protein
MATVDEVHRLVDGVPEDRVAAIGEVLRAALEADLTGDQAHRLAKQLRAYPDLTRLAAEPIRRFASEGTLSAEPDLAERGDSPHRGTRHSRVILVDTGPIVAVRSARICWSGCPVRC